jgi:hypothetical protein
MKSNKGKKKFQLRKDTTNTKSQHQKKLQTCLLVSIIKPLMSLKD